MLFQAFPYSQPEKLEIISVTLNRVLGMLICVYSQFTHLCNMKS